MIVFENYGEIEIDAITTFGVSVKEGPNPIGFFGTGLKYAVAVLLRHGCKVSISSGERHLRFTTERREVRNKAFDFVLMREGDRLTSLGFTTELGKTWQPWMAYRELYCNARDEGGSVYKVASATAATDPQRGLTQIRVEGAEVETVHSESALYFCEDAPDAIYDGVGIYRRPSQVLFYRGVRVLLLPKPATFTYNLIDRQIDLTEDRTMAHPILATWYLARALARCDDPEILQAALAPGRDALERDFDYKDSSVRPVAAFLETVGRLKESGQTNIVASASDRWRVEVPEKFDMKPVTLDEAEQKALNGALAHCLRGGFDVSHVVAVADIPGGESVFVQDHTLYLARDVILDDALNLATTLIEGAMEYAKTSNRERFLITKLLQVAT